MAASGKQDPLVRALASLRDTRKRSWDRISDWEDAEANTLLDLPVVRAEHAPDAPLRERVHALKRVLKRTAESLEEFGPGRSYAYMAAMLCRIHPHAKGKTVGELEDAIDGAWHVTTTHRRYWSVAYRELAEALRTASKAAGGARAKEPAGDDHEESETPHAWPDSFQPRPLPNQEIIVLLATKSMRSGPSSPLIRLVREFEPYWRASHPPPVICAVEGAYNMILQCGLLHDYRAPDQNGFHALPRGYRGGVVLAADLVVRAASSDDEHPLRVVYLIDPHDATSLYPEAAALKRECVSWRKTFLATHHSASEWFATEWVYRLGATVDPHDSARRRLLTRKEVASLEAQTRSEPPPKPSIALLAHDEKKDLLLTFARTHFHFLRDNFAERYATQTTGDLLNGARPNPRRARRRYGSDVYENIEKERKGLRVVLFPDLDDGGVREDGEEEPRDLKWVSAQAKSGEVQIARKVLEGHCQVAVLLEDPDVARAHVPEIQLIERTSRLPESRCLCLHDSASAAEWAKSVTQWQRNKDNPAAPITIFEAFRRLFGVELVLADPLQAHDPATPAERAEELEARVFHTAACHVLGLVADALRGSSDTGRFTRFGLGWGDVVSKVVDALPFALAVHELVERGPSQPGAPKSLELPEKLRALWAAERDGHEPADARLGKRTRLRPRAAEHLMSVPLCGLMPTPSLKLQANQLATRVRKSVGGATEVLSKPTYVSDDPDPELGENLTRHLDALDIAVFSCDPVKETFGPRAAAPMPAALYAGVKNASCSLAGICLDRNGDECDYGSHTRMGISPESLERVAQRRRSAGSESVLVVPPAGAGVDAVGVALNSHLVSTLVTHSTMAWDLVRRALRNA